MHANELNDFISANNSYYAKKNERVLRNIYFLTCSLHSEVYSRKFPHLSSYQPTRALTILFIRERAKPSPR